MTDAAPHRGSLLATALLEQMIIDDRVIDEGPNAVVAYLSWLFLGLIAAHRFYLRDRPWLFLFSWLVGVAPFWWMIDVFLIGSMIKNERALIRRWIMANRPSR